MWASIHTRLFYSRDSAQSGDAAIVAGILLTAAALDQSPPTTERAALATLRSALAGTKALDAVENLFHTFLK